MNTNERLKKAWKAYLKRQKEVVHTSTYTTSKPYTSYQDTHTIFFYEWSNIYQCPKHFGTLKAFEDFLEKECDIHLKSYERNALLAMKTSYLTCKRGCKDLLFSSTYIALQESFNHSCEGKPAPPNSPMYRPKLIM